MGDVAVDLGAADFIGIRPWMLLVLWCECGMRI